MDAALPVDVVGRTPSTVYLGTVYDQYVVVAVEGVSFDVFDPNKVVSPDMVGTSRAVELDAFIVREAAVLEAPERGISLDGEGRPEFRGRVVALGARGPSGATNEALLDVGPGTILTDPGDADGPAVEGGYLSVRPTTPYVYDVEGAMEPDERYAFFVDRLRADDPDRRVQAARYLGECGSEGGLDELVRTLRNDPAPAVRAAAAVALGRIGMAARPPGEERDPRIDAELAYARNDVDGRVREAAELARSDIAMAEEDHLHGRDWEPA